MNPYVSSYVDLNELTEALAVVISDLEALHAGIVRGDIKASSLVEQMLGSSIETLRKAGA